MGQSHDHGPDGDRRRDLHDAHDWDEHYATENAGDHVWSGQPNGTLVVEAADMEPGTALDVGCGEGADAIWLAEQGWRVTGVDPSGVALDRARAAADRAGVDVTWVEAGLTDMPGGPGTHDLVSAQYPAVPTDEGDPVATLLGAVAPGGTLLFVHHDGWRDIAREHGIDPSLYVMPDDVRGALDDAWEVEVDEVRDRPGPLPEGTEHVRDVVLRARRRR